MLYYPWTLEARARWIRQTQYWALLDHRKLVSNYKFNLVDSELAYEVYQGA